MDRKAVRVRATLLALPTAGIAAVWLAGVGIAGAAERPVSIANGTDAKPGFVAGGPAASNNGVTAPSIEGKPLPLGIFFDRPSAGLRFQFPSGFKAVAIPGQTELVRFVDDEKKPLWSLSAERRSFKMPMNLFTVQAQGKTSAGLVENTLTALKEQFPAAKVLRAGDPTNVGKYRVGVIILRYTVGGERRLAQHAIIESNDQLYYLLSMITPGRHDVAEDRNAEEQTVDPVEASAVATFRSVLDTIRLTDLKALKSEQNDRLIRFRGFLTSFNADLVKPLLIPERYQRILRDGVDVGYSYIVEKAERRGSQEGVEVGIRTRMMNKVLNGKAMPFPREDNEAFMFATIDRQLEEWSKVTVFDDSGKPHTADHPWQKVVELGASKLNRKRYLEFNSKDTLHPQNQKRVGEEGDPNQPWVNYYETHTLNVNFRAAKNELQPIEQSLPPFYLPQAYDELLPRLLPLNEPKQYAMASYVSETRQVMMRYVDIGKEVAEVPEIIRKSSGEDRAVPITDRFGYDGDRTIHYVTKKGRYLGSYAPATKLAIVPSDLETLLRIWKAKDNFALFDIPPDVLPKVQKTPRSFKSADLRQNQEEPPPPATSLPKRLDLPGK